MSSPRERSAIQGIESQVGSHAAVKDILTVGASTTDRPVMPAADGGEKVSTVKGVSRNITHVATLSKKGPALEKRQ